MADETVWKLDIQQDNSASALKNLDTILLSVKDRFDQVAQQASKAANNFKATSSSVADLANKASTAGQNFTKLDMFQARAAESAKRLDIAQAQAALALKKADDAAKDSKISTEQLAIIQARAALATEKVHTAEGLLAGAMQKVSVEAQRMASAMQQSENKSSLFTRAIDMAKNALGELASKAEMVGNRVSQATSHIEHASKSLLDFGSKIGMTVFGIQNLIQTAFNLGQALISPDASMEQTRVAFTHLLGSAQAAGDYLKQLQAFADSTPFNFPELTDDAQQMMAFGFSAQDVIPMLTDIGDAMAGMGKGKDVVSQIVMVFGQMHAAGKLNAQDMMQLTSTGIPAWQILADAMGLSVAQVQKMTTDGLIPADDAIKMLRQGMHDTFGGSMKEQAQTFNGLLSTLQDKIGVAWQAFTGPLFTQAKTGLKELGNLVSSPAFQQFAVDMGQKVGVAIQNVANFISTQVVPAFQRFEGFVSNKIIPAIMSAAHWFDQFVGHGHGVIPLLAGIGAIIASILVPAMASLAIEVVLATWPFLAIGAAVTGLVAIFMHFYNSNAGFHSFIDNIGKSILSLWNTITTNFIPVMQRIGAILQKDVFPFLAQIGGYIAEQFAPVWQQLVTLWQTQLAPIVQLIASHFDQLKPVLMALGIVIGVYLAVSIAILVGLITGLARGLATFIGGVISIISGFIQFFTGAIQFFSGLIQLAVDISTGKFGKLGADLGMIWAGIQNMFMGTWKAIVGIFQVFIGTGMALIGGFIDGIIRFFVSLWHDLVGHSIIPDMINGIIDWFQQLPGRVGDAVASMVSTIMGKINNLASDALNAGSTIVNNIAQGIRNAIGNIGGAMQSVADYISSHLPHSPAKIGPLRDLNLQGSLIPEQIAQGMQRGIPKLQSVINSMATPISTSLSVQPMPNFATPTRSFNNNDQTTQYLAQMVTLLAQMVTLQRQNNGSVTTNNNVRMSPVDVQRMNQIIQSLSGYGYESVIRGSA